jgi:uncharacterized protein with PIN domain
MSDERQNHQPKSDQSLCERCGGVLEFAGAVSRAIDHPAYKIFRCIACGKDNWFSEQDI